MKRTKKAGFDCTETEIETLKKRAKAARFPSVAAWLRHLSGLPPVEMGAPIRGDGPAKSTIAVREWRATKKGSKK